MLTSTTRENKCLLKEEIKFNESSQYKKALKFRLYFNEKNTHYIYI